MHSKFKPSLLLPLVLLAIISLLIPACTSRGNGKDTNLDSVLRQLIEAYERGEVVEFADKSDIELIDGDSVLVELICEDGKAEAVVKALEESGAQEVIYYRNRVNGIVPIDDIEALLDIPGVTHVSLPVEPVEN